MHPVALVAHDVAQRDRRDPRLVSPSPSASSSSTDASYDDPGHARAPRLLGLVVLLVGQGHHGVELALQSGRRGARHQHDLHRLVEDPVLV